MLLHSFLVETTSPTHFLSLQGHGIGDRVKERVSRKASNFNSQVKNLLARLHKQTPQISKASHDVEAEAKDKPSPLRGSGLPLGRNNNCDCN